MFGQTRKVGGGDRDVGRGKSIQGIRCSGTVHVQGYVLIGWFVGRSGPAVPNTDGGIKVRPFPLSLRCAVYLRLWSQVEASMCNLRGLLMLKLNRGDQAKACFMEALALDVKCYDAFEQLVSGEMMTVEEGPSHFSFFPVLSLNSSLRMGICSVFGLQVSNSRRLRIRSTHLYRSSSEIQARRRAYPNSKKTGGGVRPG